MIMVKIKKRKEYNVVTNATFITWEGRENLLF